jgi:DNA-binding transcriptional ArsR family regulator
MMCVHVFSGHVSKEQVEQVAGFFGLLREPNRLSIPELSRRSEGVGQSAAEAGMSQSLASHHLRPLRTARLLRAERDGKAVRYALDDAHVAEVVHMMVAHVCEPHEH